MFWKFNTPNPNHIDSLLNKEDVTLKELMDDEDILQECKTQNKNLLEFLGRPEIMEELVSLTTMEPSEELDERTRFKYPNIACELLTCDVPSINERLAANSTLAKLYPFLESEPPLNPLLASFFSKTIGVLVARKTDQHWYSYQFTCLQVLEFLKSKENSLNLFLKHLGTSAIMDLLLKLITQVEGPDMRQNLVNWLESHNVVPSLVALLDPSVDSDRHCNASQLLCKIITKTRKNILSSSEPNPLIKILKAVESPQTVDQILQVILKGKKSESSIVGGISVLLTLLGFNKPTGNRNDTSENGGNNEVEDNQEVIQSTATAILPYLKDLHNLLLEPPPKSPVQTTVETLDPPLGTTRWHVAKLLSALAATNSLAIDQELAQLGTVTVLLDLFFYYEWNNFLHREVERFLAFALNSTLVVSGDGEPPHTILIENILVKCRLIQRLLDAWEENEENTSKEGRRRGYMGHLINIANNLTQQMKTEVLKTMTEEKIPKETLDAWEAFAEGPLAEVKKVYESGVKPVLPNSDEDNAFKTVQFLTSASNQGYMNYQSQDESQPSIDTFNMADGSFSTSYEMAQMRYGKNIGRVKDSETLEEDFAGLAELFRDLCSLSFVGPDDAEVNQWDDNNQMSEFQNKASKWSNDDASDNHNSDDEGDDEREKVNDDPMDLSFIHMEVDTDPWMKGSGAGVLDTMCDPWATSGADTGLSAEEQSDWADFSKFEANFNLSTQLSEEDNAGSKETIAPCFTQETETNPPVIVPNAEVSPDDAMNIGKAAVQADANANVTLHRTRGASLDDVTPAAVATVDAVAASAVAAITSVTSVSAAQPPLDNQRFLPGCGAQESAIGDPGTIQGETKEAEETTAPAPAPAPAATDGSSERSAPASSDTPVETANYSSSSAVADSGDSGSTADSGGSGDCGDSGSCD